MNKLEQKLIVELTALPNVRWWHRNIARQDFAINGFIKHYPDILIMTQSGKLICAETKGEHLKNDLCEKLQGMLSYVTFIESRSPQIVEEYRAKLETKLSELLADRQLDDSRVAAEVVLFADKICVDEETVRLRSHIKSTLDTLEAGGSVGRKLDFIAQEMNREANTIGSKCQDLDITRTVVDMKAEIEKIREQIQNLE